MRNDDFEIWSIKGIAGEYFDEEAQEKPVLVKDGEKCRVSKTSEKYFFESKEPIPKLMPFLDVAHEGKYHYSCSIDDAKKLFPPKKRVK